MQDSLRTSTNSTYHYRHRYPIAPYLVCVAVGNYVLQDSLIALQGGPMHIRHYPFANNAPTYAAALVHTAKLLQYYETLVGPYPFAQEQYANIQTEIGGGMEHQTATFVWQDLSFSLNAHEMAHHWFGDATTCGTWQDIWLNEGFATYFEYLAAKGIPGFDDPRHRARTATPRCLQQGRHGVLRRHHERKPHLRQQPELCQSLASSTHAPLPTWRQPLFCRFAGLSGQSRPAL